MLKFARVKRVMRYMRDMHMDYLLVSATPSIYYLTGAWIAPGERMLALLIDGEGNCTLFANRLFALNPIEGLKITEFGDNDDPIAPLAKALGRGTLGVDASWPSGFLLALQEKIKNPLVVGSAPVALSRMVKDAEEIRLMRESSQMNVRALSATIPQLRAGMTENELAAVYLAEARAVGGTGPSFTPITCFGKNCAEPHHSNDDTPLQAGDSVICDVGLMHERYASDMTRTVFFGEPTPEEAEVLSICTEANAAGRAAVKPGEEMCAFDRAARSVIEKAGYGEYFIHRTGHGIGLETHEFPDNSAVSHIVAEPGMIFSVEPGIYLPGRFGVRVEDLVLVTESGHEDLTR